MPSGPEGDQEISEHTLMHPKYKTTGFYFSSCLSLFSFLPTIFFCEDFFSQLVFFFFSFSFSFLIFRLTQAPIQVSFSLLPFCIIVIYCTCNELVSIATFNSRSFGSRMGLEFLTYTTTEAFVKS